MVRMLMLDLNEDGARRHSLHLRPLTGEAASGTGVADSRAIRYIAAAQLRRAFIEALP